METYAETLSLTPCSVIFPGTLGSASCLSVTTTSSLLIWYCLSAFESAPFPLRKVWRKERRMKKRKRTYLIRPLHMFIKYIHCDFDQSRMSDPSSIVSCGDLSFFICSNFVHCVIVLCWIVLDWDLSRHSSHCCYLSSLDQLCAEAKRGAERSEEGTGCWKIRECGDIGR